MECTLQKMLTFLERLGTELDQISKGMAPLTANNQIMDCTVWLDKAYPALYCPYFSILPTCIHMHSRSFHNRTSEQESNRLQRIRLTCKCRFSTLNGTKDEDELLQVESEKTVNNWAGNWILFSEPCRDVRQGSQTHQMDMSLNFKWQRPLDCETSRNWPL